jgi:hypothetical protein
MQKLQIHSIAGLTRFAIVCGVAHLESTPKNDATAPSTSLADHI